MDQQSLTSVIEQLQTFIQLKQQHQVILAWIQLKKITKNHSFPTRNIHYNAAFRSIPGVGSYPAPIYQQLEESHKSHASQSSKGCKKYDKLASEYVNMQDLNEQMFQTFNKNDSRNFFPKNIEMTHQTPIPRNRLTQNPRELDMEDDEQFEDIVLDRLSKLEESINDMMKEKKIKEELRGIVGAPIYHKGLKEQQEEVSLPKDYQYWPNGTESDSARTPRDMPYRYYQSQQTSPINRKDRPDIIYNLKYIPLGKQSPVNIKKIKHIFERSHKDEEEQNILQNPQYFSSKYATERRQQQALLQQKQRQNEYLKNIPQTNKHKYFDFLQNNRYGIAKTSRQTAPVNFLSKKLEMKTTIQPGIKYIRTSNNSPNAIYNRNNNLRKKLQDNADFKPRKSGVSNSSNNSYYSLPSWRAHLQSTN